VGWNQLKDAGMIAILLACGNSKLAALDFSFNGVTDTGGAWAASVLMSHMSYDGSARFGEGGEGSVNKPGPFTWGAYTFPDVGQVVKEAGLEEEPMPITKPSHLKFLDMSRNRLGEKTAEGLARLLRIPPVAGREMTLTTLRLGFNSFSTKGTSRILQSLKHAEGMEELRLENCTDAGDEGAVLGLLGDDCICRVVTEFPERDRSKGTAGGAKYRETGRGGGGEGGEGGEGSEVKDTINERVTEPVELIELLVKNGSLGREKLDLIKALLQGGGAGAEEGKGKEEGKGGGRGKGRNG
jgi:hypothetical protein